MKRHIERLRRAMWSYKQPLTLVPATQGTPVSDLFVWRNSAEWETFFELMDMPALFPNERNVGGAATMMFFDTTGRLFLEETVKIAPSRRNTLALSKFLGNKNGEIGTFCVFHSHTPQHLTALGSHIAERGYLSYRYHGAPLRAYVHGNLDAVARLPNQHLQLLGGSSILRREYNLQHALSDRFIYELGMVNPTSKRQRIVCRVMSPDGKLFSSQAIDLEPQGSQLIKIVPEGDQQRIIISSHLAMARPLVFRIQNQTMDVFHG